MRTWSFTTTLPTVLPHDTTRRCEERTVLGGPSAASPVYRPPSSLVEGPNGHRFVRTPRSTQVGSPVSCPNEDSSIRPKGLFSWLASKPIAPAPPELVSLQPNPLPALDQQSLLQAPGASTLNSCSTSPRGSLWSPSASGDRQSLSYSTQLLPHMLAGGHSGGPTGTLVTGSPSVLFGRETSSPIVDKTYDPSFPFQERPHEATETICDSGLIDKPYLTYAMLACHDEPVKESSQTLKPSPEQTLRPLSSCTEVTTATPASPTDHVGPSSTADSSEVNEDTETVIDAESNGGSIGLPDAVDEEGAARPLTIEEHQTADTPGICRPPAALPFEKATRLLSAALATVKEKLEDDLALVRHLLDPRRSLIPTLSLLIEQQSMTKQDIFSSGGGDSLTLQLWQTGVMMKEMDDARAACVYLFAAVARAEPQRDPNSTKIREDLAQVLLHRGTVKHAAGSLDDAVVLYRLAMQCDPSAIPFAAYNLGVVYDAQKKPNEAMVAYSAAVTAQPKHSTALNNIGIILQNSDELEEAIVYFEKAVECVPAYPMAHVNLAVCLGRLGDRLKECGRLKESIAAYEQALAYQPLSDAFHYSLGLVSMEYRRREKALYYFQLCVHLNPLNAAAWNNLGVIMKEAGDYQRALELYTRALQVDSSLVYAWNNLAILFCLLAKLNCSIYCLCRALTLDPSFAETYNNSGIVLRDLGRSREALAAYKEAARLDPSKPYTLQNLLLIMNYIDDISIEEQYDATIKWGAVLTSNVLSASPPPAEPKWPLLSEYSRGTRPLRVGFIGAEFFTHSVSYFTRGFLREFDRRVILPIIFSNSNVEDETTALFRSLVDGFHSILGMSTAEAASLIRTERIDLLVDLSGHTANNRLDVCIHRPAPVIVTMIGYPNTTGLPCIDYRISDSSVDPPGRRQKFTEKLLMLPGTFLNYCPPSELPAISRCPYLLSPEKRITFGSFQVLSKLDKQVTALWARIMLALPNSQLIVKAKGLDQENLDDFTICGRMRDLGVDTDHQLRCLGLRERLQSHLETYDMVDLCLDPFPYCGTTTTCELLLMGIPVITLERPDSGHVSNVGPALLKSVGLSELIAHSEDEYFEKAVALARDGQRLQRYRASIRDMLLKSRLTNVPRYTRYLENAFCTVVERYYEAKEKEDTCIPEDPKIEALSPANHTNVPDRMFSLMRESLNSREASGDTYSTVCPVG